MTTIKSYSDLQQSHKLAEILPLKSADMWYQYTGISIKDGSKKPIYFPMVIRDCESDEDIPCWSLAALFNVLPLIIGDLFSENALRLRMDKGETNFNVWYENLDSGMVEEGLDIIKSNSVDACYEMIIKLKERNLI